MDPQNKAARFQLGKGAHGKTGMGLTLKEKIVVSEYLKTGKKGNSYAAAYNAKPKNISVQANQFFKKPKIIDALSKALKDKKFDDAYAVEKLKAIVEGGMANIDIARPDTALKALDTYFKITNKMGGGNKVAIKLDIESQAKKMDMVELQNSIKELDKKQKRILEVIKGGVGAIEEGEIINED